MISNGTDEIDCDLDGGMVGMDFSNINSNSNRNGSNVTSSGKLKLDNMYFFLW